MARIFHRPAGLAHDVSRHRCRPCRLIIDVADNLLQHVLNREETGHFTELIHDESEMLCSRLNSS